MPNRARVQSAPLWYWSKMFALAILMLGFALCGDVLSQESKSHVGSRQSALDQQSSDRKIEEDPGTRHAEVTRDQQLFVDLSAERLAKTTTIVRDDYGVAHVSGQTMVEAVFGLAFAQAEDFFWQIEDSYILGLGRYAEVHGPSGLNSDLLNRAFEIAGKSREDFPSIDPEVQRICVAYVNGLNYFLETHPSVKPRLIKRFEPWHVIAFGRQIVLETTFRYTRLHDKYVPRTNDRIWSESGSNAWAIGPQRTKNGSTILLANPHQPWFGFGQMCEVHLHGEQDGINFIGAGLYGSPLPTFGHNHRLGWTLTTNEPDIADVWREEFSDPDNPLNYVRNGRQQQAEEWTETICVRQGKEIQKQRHTFRKTVHGPIVARENDHQFLAANIAGLHDLNRLHQLVQMMRSSNRAEFEAALDCNEFNMMNVLYADADGNIGYYYTGAVPRRADGVDWSQPVPGADPMYDWGELHTPAELPRLVNPSIGYVQNCNSSPFVTTSSENPNPQDFPSYMIEDAGIDRRRAKRSRQILNNRRDFDLEAVSELAFDTTMYWATEQLPQLQAMYAEWHKQEPQVARHLKPYVDHLVDWDGVVTEDSTEATLCEAWYFLMHTNEYPGEELKLEFRNAPKEQIQALGQAAMDLQARFGNWKVPWGKVYRIQRVAPVADFLSLGFSDDAPSFPCLAVPGQLGAVFTQYYSPYLDGLAALFRDLDHRYGVVGTSYLAVWEFHQDNVQGASLVQFGVSGDLDAPHAFDQARLLSERRLKPENFHWADVVKSGKPGYHPADAVEQAAATNAGTTNPDALGS